MKYLKPEECVDRGVYKIKSRNLVLGVYRERTGGFIGIREKFNDKYLFEEYHHDTGGRFGTVYPKEFVEMLPDDLDARCYYDNDLCDLHERPTVWVPDNPEKETPGKRHHADDMSLLDYADYPRLIPNTALFDYLTPLDNELWEAAQKEWEDWKKRLAEEKE